jgi:hypothetical protein
MAVFHHQSFIGLTLPLARETGHSEMNTESCDCRNVQDFDRMEKPGDFYFAEREGHEGICMILPGDTWVHVMIQKGPQGGHRVWGWDGNTEKPTLVPSIHALEHWHGFMTNGQLVSC